MLGVATIFLVAAVFAIGVGGSYRVIAFALIGATAALLAGCAEHYGTAQMPACTQHCTFTDGGRQVSVAK